MHNTRNFIKTRSAVEILKHIREGALNPKELPIQDRRICVVYLRFEGYTQEEIAEILGVSRQTIIRDEKAHRKELAELVNDIDVKSFAGNLIAYAKHLTAKAIREKNHALAWKIQRELTSDLQSLGYLPRAPEQHQLQVTNFVELVQLAAKEVDAEVIESETTKLLPEESSCRYDQQTCDEASTP